MKRAIIFAIPLFLVLFALAIFIPVLIDQDRAPELTPVLSQATPQAQNEIEQAIREVIETEKAGIPAFFLYETNIDHVTVSQNGEWATAWLTPVDPISGQIVPAEPGLAIVRKEGDRWIATLPTDPAWSLLLESAPDDLIPPEQKLIRQDDMAFDPSAVLNAPYGGYYLPWKGGETMALTQSVAHDRYTPSGNAHFAFDFAKPGYPSAMFDVYAAKSGTVKQAVWQYENGNESFGNYLVLEDTTTDPVTYQLYLHFAKDSIPVEYRTVGAPVQRGQVIGVADDTGISSGNHLHFMVHTNPASYWGRSVDITFMDVTINGGRPRIAADLPYCLDTDVCDTTQYYYISGNFASPDHTPPTGGITAPHTADVIRTGALHMEGWAADEESGLASAQFMAKFDGVWRLIGESYSTENFTLNWDLCEAGVPNGPVSLALDIRDLAGNKNESLPGLTHVIKDYQCPAPPPTCSPNTNQVALFANPDYQGACVVLGLGSHNELGNLGDNNAVSILVGADVNATLYLKDTYKDRGETFQANDSNLSDNRIGAKTVSAALVQSRSTLPAIPVLTFPDTGVTYTNQDSFSLVWDNGGGATQYQARLQVGASPFLITPWQNEAFWHLNALPVGTYTWQVKARNSAGESNWSATRSLTIVAGPATPGETFPAPFIDDMETIETTWVNSNYWDRNVEKNHTQNGAISWKYDTNSQNGYDTGVPNRGHLTSPAIQLPAAGEYFLRFWYLYETENPGIHWDQRLVQISVDGGPYANLLQLSDDVTNYWLQSPVISLAAYAGHSIRIRYYFATLDNLYNNYQGWFIDDFSISATPPMACSDQDSGGSFIEAIPIEYNSATDGLICPEGDIDFFRFQGIAGDQIGAHVQAQTIGSTLDSYLYLLDIDGRSVLAENDDLVLGQRTDSLVTYKLARTGTYYFKIKDWYHPTNGGQDYFYTFYLFKDHVQPQASFIYPTNYGGIPRDLIYLTVSAIDLESGVSRVQFFWHNDDWKNADWILLGDDWDGQDGWSFPFDATNIPTTDQTAFLARVFDWAGNRSDTGVWHIGTPAVYLPLIQNP